MSIEGLLGRKLGNAQMFDDKGRLRGVTAVQVGFEDAKKLTRPAAGHLRASGGRKLRHLAEFATDTDYTLGDQIGAEIFEPGGLVDVTATSKGRGFQGGVRRHNFRGGPRTHGQSDRHRAPGSIGAGTTPGRVFKGTRMAGHMGAVQTTVRNLEIVARNDDRGVIFIAGSVPGPKGGLVRIRHAKQVAKKVAK